MKPVADVSRARRHAVGSRGREPMRVLLHGLRKPRIPVTGQGEPKAGSDILGRSVSLNGPNFTRAPSLGHRPYLCGQEADLASAKRSLLHAREKDRVRVRIPFMSDGCQLAGGAHCDLVWLPEGSADAERRIHRDLDGAEGGTQQSVPRDRAGGVQSRQIPAMAQPWATSVIGTSPCSVMNSSALNADARTAVTGVGGGVDGALATRRALWQPGGVVLEPFCGTGTTGLAALALGRQFTGIDLSTASAALAAERLRHAARQEPDGTTGGTR